jgi:exocyst complex component 1
MHKSKENPNGTFSIGKTWFLDDLSAIESFTSPTANPTFQEWAGDVGFVITLGKPYYWQAQTDKEKKFFIASLIKIYAKYTGGRMPSLTGFDQRELDQVLGGAQAPRRPPIQDRPPPPRPAPIVDTAPSSGNASIASGYNGNLSAQSTLVNQYPPERIPSRGAIPLNGTASPSRSIDSGRKSQEQAPSLRRLASGNQSQDSVATSLAARSEDARPRSRNGMNGTSTYNTPEPTPQLPEEIPPERKRPPIDPLRPSPADRDLVPAPLMSPGMRRDPVMPMPLPVPPRNVERARKGSVNRRGVLPLGDAGVPTNDTSKVEVPSGVPTPSAGTPVSINSAASPPPVRDTPAESPAEEEEDNRPGLGPMIKSKKSRGEIRGAFWKAASAATATSAFKPRRGGAGEKLQQSQNKSIDGPDGITSVVPAPPRPPSTQKPPEPAPVPQPSPKAADRSSAPGIPELKVTGANTDSRPSSLQSVAKEKKLEDTPEVEESRLVIAGNDIKYLATLGIDPSILDSRTTEFAKWLDYFGWVPGEQMRGLNFEEMRTDLDRQLNKAQAGGWLARFQEEDERVEAIKRGIDTAINECDELDNLLTLYSVELSVSCNLRNRGRYSNALDRLSQTISPILRPRARVSRCRPRTRSS